MSQHQRLRAMWSDKAYRVASLHPLERREREKAIKRNSQGKVIKRKRSR
jgi:hypothetical protein